jgi:hypothetical protein
MIPARAVGFEPFNVFRHNQILSVAFRRLHILFCIPCLLPDHSSATGREDKSVHDPACSVSLIPDIAPEVNNA